MRTTPLGSTGLTVPVQGLGCMRLGGSRAPDGDRAATAVVHRALDLGATLLDTADLYGGGRNEVLVGRALRQRRDEAILCTKFGVVPTPHGELGTRGDAAYVRSACEASLTRLGTDVIDLYYLHDRDPTVPIEETVGAMAELVKAGKVRHLGLSNVTGEDLRAAHAVHPIAALQSEWSLVGRAIEAAVPVCRELGVGVVPYCPQGAGGLSLEPVPRPPHIAGVSPTLGGVVRDIAGRHGVRPGQVALAWVHQQAEVWGVSVAPIPGTTRVVHLEENVAAAELTLDAEELTRLDQASRPGRAHTQ
ncbi:aldo/keto reductase [Micromonospora sp. KC606]|uniref:aldo/keto reductase n=1 Tax=Micromonospora sp. KC606 TaxID=2530379 RepID=UPI00104F3D46|nr:aldo/keto reductase [Micromonospora sp. KC606]TDC85984.1 aldo/keto reductase [Micromonospora sp. KC606]